MAAKTGTYTLIASTTLGSAASSITFSSISGVYTDLILVVKNLTQTTGGNTLFARVNGDTGTNYSATLLNGNGTAASSTRYSTSANGFFLGGWLSGMSTTNPAVIVFQLQDYSNTTTYKTGITRYGLASAETNTGVSLWRSTAAITEITVRIDANTIAANTVFTLYGIEAAK
jgi:hypothetical protein